MARVDAAERKSHYGDAEQPWDVIVRVGWAPQFAAGNILKYLRRDKEREHSLQSARWYLDRLREFAAQNFRAAIIYNELWRDLLTPDERVLLIPRHEPSDET